MTKWWVVSLPACLMLWITASSLSADGSSQPVEGQLPAASQAAPGADAQAVLQKYCVTCHNDRTKTAGLSLTSIDVGRVQDHPDIWEKVVVKLRARFMPPVGMPRPDAATYDALVTHLETALDRAAAAAPNPGRTDGLQRLNRTEYRNVIRDLLALDVDVSSLLPKDDENHGFDNVSLPAISTTLLERYISSAQKVSRLAVGSPVRFPAAAIFVVPPDRTQEYHVEGLPFGTRGGTAVSYTFPRDGEYEIQLRLARDRNEVIEGFFDAHQIEVNLDGAQLKLFTVEPQGGARATLQEKVDEGLRVRVPVKAGPHTIGATFLRKPATLLEVERQPNDAQFNVDRSPRPQLALYSLAIAGPYNDSGVEETPSRHRIFVCRPAGPSEEDACARTILGQLARRAYRRPVTDEDLRTPIRFYREGRGEGGFEAGIEAGLQSILTNPEFLFRVAKHPADVAPGAAYRISDLELASRLSFFLWSSIPDDELLQVAIGGTLRQPRVLEQQVKRMLADPKAEALVSNFAGQWLQLRNLDTHMPDPRAFLDFDDNLRQAFRRETELFFQSVVAEDRNVLDLLTADYTFLNERLAKHYDIPNIYGSRFRRVALPAESVRGGLLGQGSILTVTSYGNRTSPVLRGKWILENILGAAPPPPPPNVPALAEPELGAKAPSMRQRMAAHRTNPACAGCHNLMDPIGLSTETFDAIGGWRTRDEDGQAVDVAGNLPDGTKYIGIAGLKQAVLKQPDGFVTTLTRKLMTYGLGRGLEYYDAPTVRAVVHKARNQGYRFSSLILGIVNSNAFQMRRSES
jgi:mono/diheme cytochrome c family protein